jgi:hypothetical protein
VYSRSQSTPENPKTIKETMLATQL